MKRRAQPWLGTMVEIGIADPPAAADVAFDAAFAAIAEVQRLMSFHHPASDVARINRAPVGATIEVDAQTAAVLRAALALAAASGGRFDIRCAPKLVEWGYLPGSPREAPAYVPGAPGLALEGERRVRKDGAAWIDLGGIAKGYAVDRAVAALRRGGIGSACVNAGGDLRAFGARAYPVAIRDPRCPGRAALCIELRDEALATSGSYFSETRAHGRAVSALVDGSSGRPITGRASATVRAPTCMLADALTKVVLASGDSRHAALRQAGARAFLL